MRYSVGRLTSDKRFWAVLYILMALLAVVSVYEGIQNACELSQDFQYDAAGALIRGYDPYDLSLDFDRETVSKIGNLEGFYGYFDEVGAPQKMEANQFPSLLYILAPYALLPYKAARILWLVTNLISTSIIIWLLKKTFMKSVDERLYPVFMMVMLSGTPWRNQLGVGQHTLFAVAAFLAAVYVSEQGKSTVASGLLLSLSYIKYTVTAPMALYFIYKRKWKEFVISILPHAVLTVVASLTLRESIPDMLIKPLKVASALSGEGSIDVGALTGGASWSLVITLFIMAAAFAAALMLPEGNDELFISWLILISLVMTYHRTYDFFIMIAVFGYFALGRMKAAEIIYLITTFAFFYALRVFHESRASLIVSGAFYYACVIAFTVITAERILGGRKDNG